jgi:uncharacterized membrane protein YbhN (UPF0104 family)
MPAGEPASPLAALSLEESIDRFVNGAEAFFSDLADIDWVPFALALLCYLAMLLARTRSWQNVLRAAYPRMRIPYSKVTAAYLAGAGLNSFIPARVGDAVKIFLAKKELRGSTYPAITSSFFVQTVFDTPVGLLVLAYAITQGLFPAGPELPQIPAFEISFWADHPRLLILFLTALGIGTIVLFAVLARRVEAFWDRVKQGAAVLRDPDRYLREVAAWQAVAWLARFGSFWFFLEAFGIGGSVQSVLLVMSVQSISTVLPFTPGGAGAQQALLVATLEAASRTDVLSYAVGQQIAIAVWAAALGFMAMVFVFRTMDWRELIRRAEADVGEHTDAEERARRATASS